MLQRRSPGVGERVVAPWRPGRRLAPLAVQPTHPAQPRQQRVDRALGGGEVPLLAEAADDLRAVAVLVLDHGEHAEFKRPPPKAGGELRDVGHARHSTLPRKVAQRGDGTAGPGSSKSASRSPCHSTRSSTAVAVNCRTGSSPSAISATSSQVSGVEAVGNSWARSEYGATVVFAALFWLQSMKTLPGRTALAILAVIDPGTRAASSSATRLA